ncbi:MAG TPA: FAD-dependent oxidoreductase [Solirubrobacterales bacterium]|nr:FAD-dependent oxidoreductase [Solirubrobacterales bacterium]
MSDKAHGDGGSIPRVLIVGGGVAAVEVMLALRDLAGERVEVQVCAPRRDFVYRPFAVGEPYGASQILRFDLGRLAERSGASFDLQSISSVEADAWQAITHDGVPIPYDYLILAAGVQLLWPFPGATAFWGVADEAGIEHVLRGLREGELRRVAFALPGGCSWALPLYELALLADAELSKAGVEGAHLVVVTPEEVPLGVFGIQVGTEVGKLLAERGIEVVAGAHPVKFEQGILSIAPGDGVEADAVVSLPRLEGRRIAGIPHDRDGFIGTDEFGRVIGVERAFAIGDITNFPVKQGGIATQQADTAAETIASEVGCDVEAKPFDPILRGVLWTGEEPRYLYGELSGGHGETSSMTVRPPWPDQGGKIVGRYISPFLAEATEIASH